MSYNFIVRAMGGGVVAGHLSVHKAKTDRELRLWPQKCLTDHNSTLSINLHDSLAVH